MKNKKEIIREYVKFYRASKAQHEFDAEEEWHQEYWQYWRGMFDTFQIILGIGDIDDNTLSSIHKIINDETRVISEIEKLIK